MPKQLARLMKVSLMIQPSVADSNELSDHHTTSSGAVQKICE